VIRVEPVDLVRRQQGRIDEPAIDGRERERFEAVHRPLAAGDVAGLGDHDQVLDADAVVSLAVIAGLVGQDHAGLELGAVGLRQPRRPLMDGEIDADPVTGAVVKVEPGLPQAWRAKASRWPPVVLPWGSAAAKWRSSP
jgi:hypothetical protein